MGKHDQIDPFSSSIVGEELADRHCAFGIGRNEDYPPVSRVALDPAFEDWDFVLAQLTHNQRDQLIPLRFQLFLGYGGV